LPKNGISGTVISVSVRRDAATRKTSGADRRFEGPTETTKDFCPGGSAQPLEKAQNGQGIPRKSEGFSFIRFAWAWVGLAGFCWIWDRLGKRISRIRRSNFYV
jgi:hypothetical protein